MNETTRPHPSQRRYPPELRERAVRLVHERIAEAGERQGAVTRVARQGAVTRVARCRCVVSSMRTFVSCS